MECAERSLYLLFLAKTPSVTESEKQGFRRRSTMPFAPRLHPAQVVAAHVLGVGQESLQARPANAPVGDYFVEMFHHVRLGQWRHVGEAAAGRVEAANAVAVKGRVLVGVAQQLAQTLALQGQDLVRP